MSQEQVRQVEARRSEVDGNLKQATDEKVLAGSSDRAYKHARKAYELATNEPRIVGPLSAVAAYRLAHLLLRKNCDQSELREVARLFEEATELEPFRAFANIYRIAVLHRLFLLVPDPQLSKQMEESFRDALKEVTASPWDYDRDERDPAGNRQPV